MMNSEKFTTEEMSTFIGKRSDYYLKTFSSFQNRINPSWNWAAFFLDYFWLLYRKMYVWFGIYLAVTLASSAISIFPFLFSYFNHINDLANSPIAPEEVSNL